MTVNWPRISWPPYFLLISNINCRLNPYYMTADCGMRSRMRHFQTASVCLNRVSARRVAIYRGELSCLCFCDGTIRRIER